MGGGILPCTIHNNKLYFLFGKENKYADTPGWSDFGGGRDGNETPLQTALREGAEELTGFLGDTKDIKTLLKAGIYKVEIMSTSSNTPYVIHIFPMQYDANLPHYYNNNRNFLEKKIDAATMKESKIFEKAEIKWMSINDVLKNCKRFRSYFQPTCKRLYKEKKEIQKFISARLKKKKGSSSTRKVRNTRNNKTMKKKA